MAVLARRERARVRAEISSDARRSAMLKRLDGIALILAQIATRDTSLLTLLADDAVLSDAARALMRSLLQDAGVDAAPFEVTPPEPPPVASTNAERRVVPQAVVSRQLANPFLAPDFSARQTERRPAAPPGHLGAARAALQFVRTGRRGSLAVHGAARAVVAAGAGRPHSDAPPGAAGGRGRRRTPELPARRRTGPGQDGAGAARRAGGERLSVARGRAERRQDQLGPRGRALDPHPVGHRDPRRRRHDGRLRRHRRGQLRGARPPRGLDRRLRLPRHGRRRGALHQEQDLAALAARAGALRAHPVPRRAAPADGPDRDPADQRHRGLPGDLAVPRLDRRHEAARRADAGAGGDRADPGRRQGSTPPPGSVWSTAASSVAARSTSPPTSRPGGSPTCPSSWTRRSPGRSGRPSSAWPAGWWRSTRTRSRGASPVPSSRASTTTSCAGSPPGSGRRRPRPQARRTCSP